MTCDDVTSVPVECRLAAVIVGGLTARSAGWVVPAAAPDDDGVAG